MPKQLAVNQTIRRRQSVCGKPAPIEPAWSEELVSKGLPHLPDGSVPMPGEFVHVLGEPVYLLGPSG